MDLITSVFMFFMLPICAGTTGQHRRQLTDEFHVHRNFHSKFLSRDRDVVVWLPPGYDSQPARRYPVFYMLDGGDVFVSWRIDEIAKPLITSAQIEPLIIIMISNNAVRTTASMSTDLRALQVRGTADKLIRLAACWSRN